MAQQNDDWTNLIDGLRSGDDNVLMEFYNSHGATLRAIADKQLASEMRRRVGPSEVVQSAFRTFFRRAGEGRFGIKTGTQLNFKKESRPRFKAVPSRTFLLIDSNMRHRKRPLGS